MYRLLHIPERHTVLVHLVPHSHPKCRRNVAFMYRGRRVMSLMRYNLCADIKAAKKYAHYVLQKQADQEKYLYTIGRAPDYDQAEYWRPGSDAVVGRRIMDRRLAQLEENQR